MYRRRGRGKKIAIISVASFFGCLLALYIGVTVFYSSHIFSNTWFGNIELSGLSALAVEEELNKLLLDYKLTIHARDNVDEVITSSDVDLRYILDGYGDKLISEQNPFAWPVHMYNKENIDATFEVEYDKNKLSSVISSMSIMQKENIVEPEDAHVSDYISGTGYEVVKEVMGNKIDNGLFVNAVDKALSEVTDDINLEELGCYISPEVYSDNEEIVKKADYLNSFVKAKITYTFGDDVIVVDGDMIHNWMKIKKNGKVKLDEDKIAEFVNGLGSKYDTIFRKRTFKTSYGTEVTIDGGDYGWWMDRKSEVKELVKLIKKGKVTDREPVYFQKAQAYGAADYGKTYVEVNLTAQHLFFYKKGKLVLESDFVSGKETPERKTPVGVYGITYKERDATLVGEDYETPVSYWMPFNGSVGLHDAIWRHQFGANLYKGGGSHGCVNLPFNVAAKIYDKVDKGTAVICYELPGTESTSITNQSDEEIAQFVVDAIDRIGTVNKDRKLILTKFLPRIRQCYNELTYNQKKYVTNLDKLAKAEQEFKKL